MRSIASPIGDWWSGVTDSGNLKRENRRLRQKTDMPVIGVETVRNAAAAGLAGIALEAGKSLIVDKRAVAAGADKLGLFVVGVKP